jgi:hypothetical protein
VDPQQRLTAIDLSLFIGMGYTWASITADACSLSSQSGLLRIRGMGGGGEGEVNIILHFRSKIDVSLRFCTKLQKGRTY